MWYKYLYYYSREKFDFFTHWYMLIHYILKIENDVQTLNRNHFDIK